MYNSIWKIVLHWCQSYQFFLYSSWLCNYTHSHTFLAILSNTQPATSKWTQLMDLLFESQTPYLHRCPIRQAHESKLKTNFCCENKLLLRKQNIAYYKFYHQKYQWKQLNNKTKIMKEINHQFLPPFNFFQVSLVLLPHYAANEEKIGNYQTYESLLLLASGHLKSLWIVFDVQNFCYAKPKVFLKKNDNGNSND